MDICFVLFQPQQAENVGAAARALTTMGFGDLRLVNSYLNHHHRASVIAHGSAALLSAARSFPSLQSALADVDFVVGTTAKKRHHQYNSFDPDELRQVLNIKGSTIQRCAIVFGREDNGLSNTELSFCNTLSTIPMASGFPSLNLSQAVMIYAYSLQKMPPAKLPMQVETGEFQQLKARLADLLAQVEIGATTPTHRWAMAKLSTLAEKDIQMLHLLCRQLAKNIPPKKPE